MTRVFCGLLLLTSTASAGVYRPLTITANDLTGTVRIRSLGVGLVVRWDPLVSVERGFLIREGSISHTHYPAQAVTSPAGVLMLFLIGKDSCLGLVVERQDRFAQRFRGGLYVMDATCQHLLTPWPVRFNMRRGGMWR